MICVHHTTPPMNSHNQTSSEQYNKMFNVGVDNNHEQRVTHASISTNVMPLSLYGLCKTHKEHNDGEKGPPLRPVCGANVAPNSHFSSFISRILYDYCDSVSDSSEVLSSEEMSS